MSRRRTWRNYRGPRYSATRTPGPLHIVRDGIPSWSHRALCGAYPDYRAELFDFRDPPDDARACPKCRRLEKETS